MALKSVEKKEQKEFKFDISKLNETQKEQLKPLLSLLEKTNDMEDIKKDIQKILNKSDEAVEIKRLIVPLSLADAKAIKEGFASLGYSFTFTRLDDPDYTNLLETLGPEDFTYEANVGGAKKAEIVKSQIPPKEKSPQTHFETFEIGIKKTEAKQLTSQEEKKEQAPEVKEKKEEEGRAEKKKKIQEIFNNQKYVDPKKKELTNKGVKELKNVISSILSDKPTTAEIAEIRNELLNNGVEKKRLSLMQYNDLSGFLIDKLTINGVDNEPGGQPQATGGSTPPQSKETQSKTTEEKSNKENVPLQAEKKAETQTEKQPQTQPVTVQKSIEFYTNTIGLSKPKQDYFFGDTAFGSSSVKQADKSFNTKQDVNQLKNYLPPAIADKLKKRPGVDSITEGDWMDKEDSSTKTWSFNVNGNKHSLELIISKPNEKGYRTVSLNFK